MGDLREIVDLDALNRWFAWLALVLPLAGLVIGAAWGTRTRRLRQGAIAGLLVGLIGTGNWLLWKVYNAITNALGLDTVRNVLVNLALFAGAGVIVGACIGYALRCLQSRQVEEEIPIHRQD